MASLLLRSHTSPFLRFFLGSMIGLLGAHGLPAQNAAQPAAKAAGAAHPAQKIDPAKPTPTPSGPVAAAAAAVAKTDTAKDRYAGEAFVIERADWVYVFNADGTGYRERTIVAKMQSEAALRAFGVIQVGFASASEHVEFHYARVRRADGTVVETPVSGAMEQPEPVTREAPEYSDLKSEQLPVKDLHVGDTLEWQARIVVTRAEAPNEFWGQESFLGDEMVVREESIELRVPAAETVTVWTNPELNVKPAESMADGRKVYRWETAQLDPTTGPEADARKKAKKGKLLSDAEVKDQEDGKLPSVAWTTFKSWADVGAWYRGLEGDRIQPDDEIKAKVAELTKDSKTEEDKARAVYAFVSAQVRYVGVSFGVGRMRPHEADDTLHSQYGDCKDKATLLTAMLGAIGLKADAVLIGAGVRMNDAVPSPGWFNHEITRVSVDGKEVWLDATQEVAPYEALLYMLRDKQALVIPQTGAAELMKTPKDLPFASLDTWKAVGTLKTDGSTDSHITMTFRGDNEMEMRMAIHQVAPANYDDVSQRIMKAINYPGTSSHASFSRPEDTEKPFVYELDYHADKDNGWDNLKVSPQLPWLQLPTVDESDPPVAPLNLGPPQTSVASAELKIPDGWTAVLPEAVHENTQWVTYDESYRFDKGTIYTDRKVVVLEARVPAEDWKAYKKWADAVGLGSERWIVLVKPGADGKPMAAAHVSNKEAESLVQQAFDAVKANDIKTAELLLKRAKAIDPEADDLWSAYADIAWKRGKLSEAIDDYHHELQIYPQEYRAYGFIGDIEYARGDKAADEQALRQWAAGDSTNEWPNEVLARVLLEDNKGTDAVAAAKAALAAAPADNTALKERLEVLVGQAQLKAGMTKDGESTLVTTLKATADPGTMNDAAYELADEKLDLELDQQKELESLKKLSDETQSWTLDEDPATLRQKSSLVTAAWDTEGWILYRQGKFAEAKPWIEAAWLNQHHADVKKHLDEVDQALNAKAEDSGHKIEQEQRTIELGANTSGATGTAEYRVLLSHGKVERDEATGDKSVAGADTMLKAASFMQFFPPASDARLVKTGMLTCTAEKCEFVIEP